MVAMMSGWRLALPDLAIGHELFAAMGTDRVTFRWVIRVRQGGSKRGWRMEAGARAMLARAGALAETPTYAKCGTGNSVVSKGAERKGERRGGKGGKGTRSIPLLDNDGGLW